MASNLIFLFPELFIDGSLTSSHTYSTSRPLKNLWSGGRGDIAELATAAQYTTTIRVDQGSVVPSSVCTGLAVCRAKLLRGTGVTSFVMRGLGVPFDYPAQLSGLKFWLDPKRNVTATSDTLRISAITDSSSTAAAGSQATEANRPFYSNASNASNIVKYSENFSGSLWTTVQATITTDQYIDPVSDCNLAADLLLENAMNAQHGVYMTSDTQFVAGTTYRASFYAKKRDRQWVFIEFNAPNFAASRVWFDLTNGVIGSNPSSLTASITSLNNGWYRIQAEAVATTTGKLGQVGIYSASANGTSSFIGSTLNGTYIFGAHVAESAADSTYLKTDGGIRHRGINSNRALFCERTSELAFGNPAALAITGDLSCFASIKPKWDGVASYTICDHHSLNANGWRFYVTLSAGQYYLTYQASQAGTNQIVTSTTALSTDTVYSVGFTKSGTTITFYVNGSSAGSGTATNPVAPTTNFRLGSTSVGFNGYIGDLVVYNRALSGSEITGITSYLTIYSDSSASNLIAIHDIQSRTLQGPRREDIFSAISLQAGRYFQIEFDSEKASLRRCGHIYVGAGVDLGFDPLFGRLMTQRKDSTLQKSSYYQIAMNFDGVTNSNRTLFKTSIERYSDARTLALIEVTDLSILLGARGMECEIESADFVSKVISKNMIKVTANEAI